MEQLEGALSRLTKESKELISAAYDSLWAAVADSGVPPVQAATAIARSFSSTTGSTTSSVGSADQNTGGGEAPHAFPVLCLLDALLLKAKAAAASAGSAGEAEAEAEATVLPLVLAEVWALLPPPRFAVLHAPPQPPAVQERAARLLKRWRARRLLADDAADDMLAYMERGPAALGVVDETTGASAATEAGSSAATAGGGGTAAPSTPDGTNGGNTAMASSSSPAAAAAPDPDTEGIEHVLSRTEVSRLLATVRRCSALLARLPPERAAAYAADIQLAHHGRPSRAALAFLEETAGRLQRELAPSQNATGGGASAAAAGAAAAAAAAAPQHTRDALARVLRDQAAAAAGLNGADGDDGGDGFFSAAAAASAAYHGVVRYPQPLFTDAAQRETLRQRHGCGDLRLPPGATNSESKPFRVPPWQAPSSSSSSSGGRPFRIPMAVQGGRRARRVAFPSPAAWAAAPDTAALALFEERPEDASATATTTAVGPGADSPARRRARVA